jgi:hypothetical protein
MLSGHELRGFYITRTSGYSEEGHPYTPTLYIRPSLPMREYQTSFILDHSHGTA